MNGCEAVYKHIKAHPKCTSAEIAKGVKLTRETVQRALEILHTGGHVEATGTRQTGKQGKPPWEYRALAVYRTPEDSPAYGTGDKVWRPGMKPAKAKAKAPAKAKAKAKAPAKAPAKAKAKAKAPAKAPESTPAPVAASEVSQ